MARARFIRPEFFTDEKVGELPFGARLLFAGIWCHCDLRGVFEHNPKRLRVLVFPFDEGTTSKQVGEWLDMLTRGGLVARFEADGKSWGHVRQWERHQSISGSEARWGSKLPPPPTNHSRNDTVTDSSTADCHAQAATLTLTLTPTLTPTPTCSEDDQGDITSPSSSQPATAPIPRSWMDWRLNIGRHLIYLDREGNSESSWAELFNRAGWDVFTKAFQYCAERSKGGKGKVFLSNMLEVISL